MRRLIVPCAAALAATPAPSQAQQATLLFSDTAPLRLTIRGPIATVARNRNENATPQAATMLVDGQSLPITLAPRGITRRRTDICQFPPLRVQFTSPPPATSLFAGQRRLKLVTHCRSDPGFQRHVLLEYAGYRLFNLLSPLSFRARLASIDYVDPGGRPVITRYGFFIEEADDLARRAGARRATTGPRVPASALHPSDSVRAALFQYMIGNLDWSMRAGPAEEGCCHNFRLLRTPGSPLLSPVPYDFDFAGLVDAPYAVPPAELPVRSVRQRHYRGYCAHNGQLPSIASEFLAKRPQLSAVLTEVPLDERSRQRAAAYLGQFFADLADSRTITARLLKSCVR